MEECKCRTTKRSIRRVTVVQLAQSVCQSMVKFIGVVIAVLVNALGNIIQCQIKIDSTYLEIVWGRVLPESLCAVELQKFAYFGVLQMGFGRV